MLQRIRTSIRSERRALLALALVTGTLLVAVAVVAGLGDRRSVAVLLTTPVANASVTVTQPSLSITFSREVQHGAVEKALSFHPAAAGSVRWHGRTLDYVFREALQPGTYEVRIAAGPIGATAERLSSAFTLRFAVRAPGIVLVQELEGGERLVEVRDGKVTRAIAEGRRLVDFAVSPDGTAVAAITAGDDPEATQLVLAPAGGAAATIVDSRTIVLGGVGWSADSQALLVVRRDRAAPDQLGVPRTWVVRKTGEFLAPIDPDGIPTGVAAWSPDNQRIAYVAPATGQLLVRNLSTQQAVDLGPPRGGTPSWSPDSKLLAFESVPTALLAPGQFPPQPIRVRSVDGDVDRTLGAPGEVRSAPRFLDADTVMSLRRVVGDEAPGTELLFESVTTGQLLRSSLLTIGADSVTSWDLDPTKSMVVYGVEAGSNHSVLVLDLASGKKTPLATDGDQAAWLP